MAQVTVTTKPVSRVPGWRIFSWQMYDFADTIYSMNVYTMYFGLFLASAFGRSATDFGWALTIANLVVAVTSPLLGAMSDASQRRLPFLRFFAVASAISTAMIALAPSLTWLYSFSSSHTCYFLLFALPGLTQVPDFAPPSRKVSLDVGAAYRRMVDTITHAHLWLIGPFACQWLSVSLQAAVLKPPERAGGLRTAG